MMKHHELDSASSGIQTQDLMIQSGGLTTLPHGPSYSKCKEFAPLKFNSFFLSKPLFRTYLVCRKANRKPHKLSVLYDITENLPSVSHPLKTVVKSYVKTQMFHGEIQTDGKSNPFVNIKADL